MTADIERWDPPNDPMAFESLCLDLWRDIWQEHAQKNGRSGQPQSSVDVFGQHRGKWIGVQCKQKDGLLRSKLTITELNSEVTAATQFTPSLSVFIIATTGPRDAALQKRDRELTEEHKKRGLFSIEIWSWDDIWPELYGREQLLRRIAPVYWPRRSMIRPLTTADETAQAELPATMLHESPISPDIKDRMERARIARRRHDFPLAKKFWNEIEAMAGQSNDPAISFRARLEKARLQLEDEGDADEALKTIEACLEESKRINVGKQRARLLQLLGEIHRIKGNVDQARGFLNSARASAHEQRDKCDEAWALLALAAVDYRRGESSSVEYRLDLIRQAYDCFSAVYVAGDDDNRLGQRRVCRVPFVACGGP
jgi:tetratricopeptide (TPR) repeat protein